MKNKTLILTAGLLLSSSVLAFNLPKIPKIGGTEQGAPSPAPSETPTNNGNATLDQLKSCCNQVRYTKTNTVAPTKAASQMQNCISQAGGSWEKDQVGPNNSGLMKRWWQKGFGGADSCLTVELSCGKEVCDSCTVVPSMGQKSYCAPIPR